MKVNNLKKIFITLGATILIVFSLVFFVMKPLLVQVKHQSIKYQEKSLLFERRKELESYLRRLKADVKIAQERSLVFKGMLLDSDKTVDFIVRLEEIAIQTNNWQELSIPASKEKKEKYPSQEFNVTLEGSFPNLIRYLVHLENMKWFVGVDSLKISRIQEESRLGKELPEGILPGDVQTNLGLRTFTSNSGL